MSMEYFCCFNAYAEKTKNLTDAELGQLFRALMQYNATGKEPNREEILPYAAAAFDFIRYDIDAKKTKYDEQCERMEKVNESRRRAGSPRKSRSRNETDEVVTTSCEVVDKPETINQKPDVVLSPIGAKTTPPNPQRGPSASSAPADETEPDVSANDGTVLDYFEHEIGTLPRSGYDTLRRWMGEGVDPELVRCAIDEAAANNRRSFAYVRGVVDNCLAENVRTAADFRARKAARAGAPPGKAKKSNAQLVREKCRELIAESLQNPGGDSLDVPRHTGLDRRHDVVLAEYRTG